MRRTTRHLLLYMSASSKDDTVPIPTNPCRQKKQQHTQKKQKTATIPTTTTAPDLTLVHIFRPREQVLGCEKSPRYGHGEEPPVVCQNHKKAGMFTVRDGKMMMATRDGSGAMHEVAMHGVINRHFRISRRKSENCTYMSVG